MYMRHVHNVTILLRVRAIKKKNRKNEPIFFNELQTNDEKKKNRKNPLFVFIPISEHYNVLFSVHDAEPYCCCIKFGKWRKFIERERRYFCSASTSVPSVIVDPSKTLNFRFCFFKHSRKRHSTQCKQNAFGMIF